MNLEKIKEKLKDQKVQKQLMYIWIWMICLILVVSLVRSIMSLLIVVWMIILSWWLLYVLFSKDWVDKMMDKFEEWSDKLSEKIQKIWENKENN